LPTLTATTISGNSLASWMPVATWPGFSATFSGFPLSQIPSITRSFKRCLRIVASTSRPC